MARESGVPQAQQLALGKLKDIATEAGLYLAGGTGLAHHFEDALADVLLPRGLTPSIWQEVERYFQAESSRVMEQNVGR